MSRVRMGLGLALVTLVAACGSGNGDSPTSPSATPGGGAQVTIVIGSDGAVTPRSVTVTPGSRVTFTNNHNRPHDMSSDPHPEHIDCPEIDQAGLLQPGQSRQTGNLNARRTCGFHDHDNPTNRNLQGTIAIQ